MIETPSLRNLSSCGQQSKRPLVLHASASIVAVGGVELAALRVNVGIAGDDAGESLEGRARAGAVAAKREELSRVLQRFGIVGLQREQRPIGAQRAVRLAEREAAPADLPQRAGVA